MQANDEKPLILLVDDSPETLRMLSDVLEAEGMSTLVALEANQAINIARKMLPDLILLDAIMPNINGFEMCKQLKLDSELRDIPVIFMTGLSDTQNVVKAFESGGVDYVTKPIKTSELIARMHVHLANAKLVLSARCALDIAGQNIFAVNPKGEILWATPHVKKELESFNPNALDVMLGIKPQIGSWLAQNPNISDSLKVKEKGQTVKISLLAKTNSEEILMKLHDKQSDNKANKLVEHLNLTAREAEVLLWISRGKTNREIAQILGTSPRTINKHSDNIYKKLEVDNRTSATTKALQFLEH